MGHAKKEQITVFPTNVCNMQCIYCAADSGNHQRQAATIDLRFAKRGIADYFADGRKHQLRFYSSGEPTQAMGIVDECWHFAHSLVGPRLVSGIQSNCHFGDDVAEWFARHISIVWASIDGPPDVQNKQRPVKDDDDPAKTVMENALRMKERTFVGIRSTITAETVDRQVDLIDYFADLGFTQICSEPVFAPVKNQQVLSPGRITGVDLDTYARGFVEAWFHAEKRGVMYSNSFICNFDEPVEYYCRSCLPTPHLTTDGFVSACDLGFYGATPLHDLLYGRYLPDEDRIKYWPEAIKKLRSRKCANMPVCRNCPAQRHCGGGCLGRNYHETRDFYGVIPDYCRVTRYLARRLPLDRIRFERFHP